MFECIESRTIAGWLTSRHMICHFFGAVSQRAETGRGEL